MTVRGGTVVVLLVTLLLFASLILVFTSVIRFDVFSAAVLEKFD